MVSENLSFTISVPTINQAYGLNDERFLKFKSAFFYLIFKAGKIDWYCKISFVNDDEFC